MTNERIKEIEALCLQMRNDLIDLLYVAKTGHPGGSLSCCEIVTTLFQEIMKMDPKNPKKEDRDHLILSKGHAAPMLYLNMAHRGFFPEKELRSFRQIGSRLQGHPCAHKLPGVEISTGPLGLGLGAGLGMALADRKLSRDNYTYVILGDGEIQEGAIWEAAMAASKYKEDHLIAILDHNGVQLDGLVNDIMPLGNVWQKWEAFGWKVIKCLGHSVEDICRAIDDAKCVRGQPVIIIAETVKGKGISFMEGKSAWHGRVIEDAEYAIAKRELER